jgi:hypothetical protein
MLPYSVQRNGGCSPRCNPPTLASVLWNIRAVCWLTSVMWEQYAARFEVMMARMVCWYALRCLRWSPWESKIYLCRLSLIITRCSHFRAFYSPQFYGAFSGAIWSVQHCRFILLHVSCDYSTWTSKVRYEPFVKQWEYFNIRFRNWSSE